MNSGARCTIIERSARCEARPRLLSLLGKQCHASRPHLGRNTLRACAHDIVALEALHREFPRSDPRFEPPQSTFEPTQKEANVPNVNTIPGEDVFYMDSRILPKVKVPCVIDADGLNVVASRPEVLGRLAGPAVLTPHPGESARLAGRTSDAALRHRLEMVPELAARHKVIVVLKGHRTLVAAPDGRVFVNPTGNPGLATGGTGDVLGLPPS